MLPGLLWTYFATGLGFEQERRVAVLHTRQDSARQNIVTRGAVFQGLVDQRDSLESAAGSRRCESFLSHYKRLKRELMNIMNPK